MLLYLYGIISYINEIFTLLVIFPTIIAFGAYLTYKLRFFQIRQLKKSFNLLLHQKSSDVGNISHFEAISTVLAGNFGTGNISGMAVALATGGAGALVWMWIMIFFAVTVQYASCLLGVSYRQKNLAGEYVGGPMYYILHGAKKPWLTASK